MAAQWILVLLWMRKPWQGSEFKGGAAADELHDLADDAVLQIVGWGCVCDREFVAMEPLGLGSCLRMWFLTWFYFSFHQ